MQYHNRGQYFTSVEDERRRDFGIVEFPFVLTPVSKVRMLNIESLLLQREEMRSSMALSVLLRFQLNQNPWLVLKAIDLACPRVNIQEGKTGPVQDLRPSRIGMGRQTLRVQTSEQQVRRSTIVEDALQQLAVFGRDQLKKPLKVVFDGEEGVDEGGVQKEPRPGPREERGLGSGIFGEELSCLKKA
eukprot:g7472.t1